LKTLIKEVLREIVQRQSGGSRTSTYENYTVNLESLEIPGISTSNDVVELSVSVDYETDPGEPAAGMYGPPEHSSPGEAPSLTVLDYYPTNMTVYMDGKDENEVDMGTLDPHQKKTLDDALTNYMETNNDKVEQDIKDELEKSEPDYVDEPEDNR